MASTHTQKGRNFIATPLDSMVDVYDLPSVGEKGAEVLESMGITTTKQVFGLYLQFNDPDDFTDFLEGKGFVFSNQKHRSELLAALGGKWDIIKNL